MRDSSYLFIYTLLFILKNSALVLTLLNWLYFNQLSQHFFSTFQHFLAPISATQHFSAPKFLKKCCFSAIVIRWQSVDYTQIAPKHQNFRKFLNVNPFAAK